MTEQERLEDAYERLSYYRNDTYEAMFPNNNESEDWELIFNAIKDLELYKKALDKACELLEKFQIEDAISNDIFGKIEIISKEKWKNYLLKESEKQ